MMIARNTDVYAALGAAQKAHRVARTQFMHHLFAGTGFSRENFPAPVWTAGREFLRYLEVVLRWFRHLLGVGRGRVQGGGCL